MQPDAILGALEKINDRLGSVEQNLQHQTMRIDALPTREEFEDRVAGLPTREESKREHEETRRHIDARFEEVRTRFNILADGYGHLLKKLDKVHKDLKKDIAGVDRRVMKLEVHTGLIGGQH